MADRKLGIEISELLEALESSGYVSCAIQTDGAKLYMRRPVHRPAPAPSEAPSSPAAAAEPDPRTLFRSPRVGHFFPGRGQGGDALSAGDRVAAGQVYGTIEAMHLKFELRAERAGVVREFLAAEGEAVEYGQPLLALTEAEA